MPRRAFAIAAAVTLGLGAAWTAMADAPASPGDELRGAVKVDGSSTVYPFAEAVAEEFSKKHPDVKVTVGQSGTGGGFKRFGAGEIDFANASRPITKSEAAACEAKSIAFVEIPVAFDGLSIVVNRGNDWVKQLTVEQITRLFSADGKISTWKDLDPSWPAETIKLYAPGTDSGTFDYFREVTVGKSGKIRSDMSVSETDNVLVRGVEGDRNAIGFFGYAYLVANEKRLRAVPVVNPKTGTAVMPSPASIEDGTYAPFGRPLFVYATVAALGRPAGLAYAEFMLEHAGELAQEVGYVKLPDAVYERARANLKARRTGTQWLDAEGKDRHGPISDLYR
ncbi:MAG: Phosphate-binding protein PstS precursor [Planctomycetota bacterium]